MHTPFYLRVYVCICSHNGRYSDNMAVVAVVSNGMAAARGRKRPRDRGAGNAIPLKDFAPEGARNPPNFPGASGAGVIPRRTTASRKDPVGK